MKSHKQTAFQKGRSPRIRGAGLFLFSFFSVSFSVLFVKPVFPKDYTEFIWTQASFPSAHASTIVETSEGVLISAWFGGTDEGNKDVGIWSSQKKKNDPWSAPVQLFKEPKQPAWNPVLFRDASNVIWLFFKVGPNPERWTGAYIQSKDGGKNWSPVVWLPAGLLGPVRNKPIILSNGNILSGTSVESYRAWASWMELSEDAGKTWRRYGPILFPTMEQNRKGTIQPTLLEIKPGVVRAFFRTRAKKIATSISNDGGKNWSELKLTDLPHPDAGIDSVRLRDGRCLLVYNPSTKFRNPLAVAISEDSGETWRNLFDLDRLEKDGEEELSYPNVIQAADGDVHVVYTWKRERIKHAQIPLGDLK